MKKDSRLFDLTVCAYDGMEVCKLLGTFLLYKLSLKYNKKNIGFYHNDGLALLKKVKKDIQKLFKENEVDIIIQYNKNDKLFRCNTQPRKFYL